MIDGEIVMLHLMCNCYVTNYTLREISVSDYIICNCDLVKNC